MLLATLSLSGCISPKEDQPPIVVIDPQKVSNLKDLVDTIIKGAGKFAPTSINFDQIYSVLAASFVEKIEDAIKLGIEIPRKILDLLPDFKKTFVPVIPAGVATMMFSLYGVYYVIPIASLFKVVLGSFLVMFVFIKKAIINKQSRADEML